MSFPSEIQNRFRSSNQLETRTVLSLSHTLFILDLCDVLCVESVEPVIGGDKISGAWRSIPVPPNWTRKIDLFERL